MWQVVYCLVIFLSAAVLAWAKNSSSLVAVVGEVVDGTLIISLMPEALTRLLDNEPWLQIAGKVSETFSFNVHFLLIYSLISPNWVSYTSSLTCTFLHPWIFFMSLPDTVGKGVMFIGCPVGTLVHLFVLLFVESDIVITISHERLEQFW